MKPYEIVSVRFFSHIEFPSRKRGTLTVWMDLSEPECAYQALLDFPFVVFFNGAEKIIVPLTNVQYMNVR